MSQMSRVCFILVLIFASTVSYAQEECSCATEKALTDTCKKQLIEQDKSIDQLESKLAASKQLISETQSELKDTKKKLDAATSELKDTKKQLESTKSELTKYKSSHKTEVVKLQERADLLEQQLFDLKTHHHASWLPHWMDQGLEKINNYTSKYTTTAKHASQRAYVVALATWKQHGVPLTIKAFQATKEGFTHAKHAYNTYSTRFIQSSFYASSKLYLAQVYSTLRSYNVIARVDDGARAATHHFARIFSELESVVVKVAGKYDQLRVLTERPLSAVAVWFLLGAPLLALFVAVFASKTPSAAAERTVVQRGKGKGKGKSVSSGSVHSNGNGHAGSSAAKKQR